ncbi:MAG: adenine phosphoribosyltransferase [Deltaproteobacteria bacterium]|nr:adenine phosphoribosyltransferase [Deltaproteobacteria bacterium]
MVELLKKAVRDVPDFPRKGILFRDITTLCKDAALFQRMVDLLSHRYIGKDIDLVVGIEARGFVIGAALAYKLGAGIVLVRKPGKLPSKTHRASYALEYGKDTLEIHQDAIRKGQKVVIADDLLATGGTAGAVTGLVRKMGGKIVECSFIIELEGLKGRSKLTQHPVFSLIKY